MRAQRSGVVGFVAGIGCLVAIGATAIYACSEPPPERVAPEPPRRHGEMSSCPARPPDESVVWVGLTTTELSLNVNDGTRILMPCPSERCPFDELRRFLRDRFAADPSQRRLFVSPQQGVMLDASARAIDIARETGFTGATLCRMREPVPLMEGLDPRGGGGTGTSGPQSH